MSSVQYAPVCPTQGPRSRGMLQSGLLLVCGECTSGGVYLNQLDGLQKKSRRCHDAKAKQGHGN